MRRGARGMQSVGVMPGSARGWEERRGCRAQGAARMWWGRGGIRGGCAEECGGGAERFTGRVSAIHGSCTGVRGGGGRVGMRTTSQMFAGTEVRCVGDSMTRKGRFTVRARVMKLCGLGLLRDEMTLMIENGNKYGLSGENAC